MTINISKHIIIRICTSLIFYNILLILFLVSNRVVPSNHYVSYVHTDRMISPSISMTQVYSNCMFFFDILMFNNDSLEEFISTTEGISLSITLDNYNMTMNHSLMVMFYKSNDTCESPPYAHFDLLLLGNKYRMDKISRIRVPLHMDLYVYTIRTDDDGKGYYESSTNSISHIRSFSSSSVIIRRSSIYDRVLIEEKVHRIWYFIASLVSLWVLARMLSHTVYPLSSRNNN